MKRIFLILCWALYDLANQFFALNIVSLYFVRWLTLEKRAPEILYSLSFGISTFFVAILGTILGIASDVSGRRKPHLIWLTLISVIFTMLLGIKESVFINLIFFAIANFGCQAAVVFYNSLMVNIAPRSKFGLVSGLGKAFGYSGAILALFLIKPIVLRSGYRATFLPTGILFLLFSLPCLIFVKDKIKPASVKNAPFNPAAFPGLADFLKAAFCGLAAVNAIILFMSVYATRVFGLNEAQVINLIGFSTLFAIVGSFLSGFLSDYLGHKRCLLWVFILWSLCFLFGAVVKNVTWYWFIGGLVGIVLGSTWVVSRSLAISLVPEERTGEIFGLFNFVGYLSAIVGAVFWGVMVWLLKPMGELGYRITLFSLVIFTVPGFIFLLRVPKDKCATKL
ncbi:MAG TPA: MFS transporter [Candidatus Omnitrophota bacterium]|nr:MFS transporter [Candidatus Omnitrophota bacterium]